MRPALPCPRRPQSLARINPGHIQRVVWHCGAECDPGDIRAELLGLGVDESCLGRYGLPKRALVPGMRVTGRDPASSPTPSACRRSASSRPTSTASSTDVRPGHHRGRRGLAGDPLVLLGVNADDFYGLADRAGIDPKYKYRLSSTGSGPMGPRFTRGAIPNPTVVLTAAGAEMSNMHVRPTEPAVTGWKNPLRVDGFHRSRVEKFH